MTHIHQFLPLCQCWGTTVWDCSCGMRKHTKPGPDGSENVAVSIGDSSISNVIFNHSKLEQKGPMYG